MVNNPVLLGTTLSSNKTAVGLMFFAVIASSVLPLFVALEGGENPFIFNAAYRIGLGLCALLLLPTFSSLLISKSTWKLIAKRVISLTMLLWVINYFDVAFYAWSVQFIDVAISAVLYEIWPILLILLTGWLFKSEKRYRKINARTFVLLAFALLGVAAVIISQVGGIGNLRETSPLTLGIGVTIILIASVTSALGAFGFRWGADLASELSDRHEQGQDAEITTTRFKGDLELFGIIMGIVICSLITSPLLIVSGVAQNESLSLATIMYGSICGIFGGGGAIAWRKANLITNDLSINAVLYFTPLASLIWLFVFSQVGEVSIGYLIIGAVAIVIANVGLYIDLNTSQQQAEVALEQIDVSALVAAGESDSVEFKSTLRTNLHTNKRDRAMEDTVIKTLAAFLNSDGGILVIGVSDAGSPVGISADNFANEDRMSLHLRNLVIRDMGALAMTNIQMTYEDYDDVRVMVVRCIRAEQVVYVKDQFYIRTGPSTTELTTSQAVEYISTHFNS